MNRDTARSVAAEMGGKLAMEFFREDIFQFKAEDRLQEFANWAKTYNLKPEIGRNFRIGLTYENADGVCQQ